MFPFLRLVCCLKVLVLICKSSAPTNPTNMLASNFNKKLIAVNIQLLQRCPESVAFQKFGTMITEINVESRNIALMFSEMFRLFKADLEKRDETIFAKLVEKVSEDNFFARVAKDMTDVDEKQLVEITDTVKAFMLDWNKLWQIIEVTEKTVLFDYLTSLYQLASLVDSLGTGISKYEKLAQSVHANIKDKTKGADTMSIAAATMEELMNNPDLQKTLEELESDTDDNQIEKFKMCLGLDMDELATKLEEMKKAKEEEEQLEKEITEEQKKQAEKRREKRKKAKARAKAKAKKSAPMDEKKEKPEKKTEKKTEKKPHKKSEEKKKTKPSSTSEIQQVLQSGFMKDTIAKLTAGSSPAARSQIDDLLASGSLAALAQNMIGKM